MATRRRSLLAAVAGVGVGVLAGCSADIESPTGGPPNTPVPTADEPRTQDADLENETSQPTETPETVSDLGEAVRGAAAEIESLELRFEYFAASPEEPLIEMVGWATLDRNADQLVLESGLGSIIYVDGDEVHTSPETGENRSADEVWDEFDTLLGEDEVFGDDAVMSRQDGAYVVEDDVTNADIVVPGEPFVIGQEGGGWTALDGAVTYRVDPETYYIDDVLVDASVEVRDQEMSPLDVEYEMTVGAVNEATVEAPPRVQE